MNNELNQGLAKLPLVAILRGLTLEHAVSVGSTLVENGFRIIEVPLNSPQATKSIETLALGFGERVMIGAGTVLTTDQVKAVADAGGRLIVAPNFNPAVVKAALTNGLTVIPGVATPTEGFAALDAGADGLKIFPAEMITPQTLKAWRAVFPPETQMLPVGGIDLANISAYWQAGASGFGLGSALFSPTTPLRQLATNAERFAGLLWELIDDAADEQSSPPGQ